MNNQRDFKHLESGLAHLSSSGSFHNCSFPLKKSVVPVVLFMSGFHLAAQYSAHFF
jgi:hypothetical protein